MTLVFSHSIVAHIEHPRTIETKHIEQGLSEPAVGGGHDNPSQLLSGRQSFLQQALQVAKAFKRQAFLYQEEMADRPAAYHCTLWFSLSTQ